MGSLLLLHIPRIPNLNGSRQRFGDLKNDMQKIPGLRCFFRLSPGGQLLALQINVLQTHTHTHISRLQISYLTFEWFFSSFQCHTVSWPPIVSFWDRNWILPFWWPHSPGLELTIWQTCARSLLTKPGPNVKSYVRSTGLTIALVCWNTCPGLKGSATTSWKSLKDRISLHREVWRIF